MTLVTLWFVLIAVLWGGFFVLEGFDFGVGMVHRHVGRDAAERRASLGAITPFWDGNEVWLVVAVAAMFAAFPSWYATMFSALYLVVLALVTALILRGIALEFRDRSADPRWQATWDRVLPAASLVAPLMVGIALGNLLGGVPIDSDQEFTGDVLDLLHPYPLLVGITLALVCVVHGATFTALRTTGEVRARSAALARWTAPAAAVVVLLFVSWTHHVAGHGWVPGPVGFLAVVAVASCTVLLVGGREGWAFTATAVGMGAAVAALFVDLYPRVMVSSTGSANDLTTANTAAGHYSLQVMTVVAAVLLPLVLAYSAWTYVVLRRRISVPAGAVVMPREPQPAPQPEP